MVAKLTVSLPKVQSVSALCLPSPMNVNLESLQSLNVFEILLKSVAHLFFSFPIFSHPFAVRLFTLCKEEIRRSKAIRKLRSSIGV